MSVVDPFKGPQTVAIDGGLGRRAASTDKVMALICGGVATNDVALGDIIKIIQPEDLDALGINAAYDANNGILVRHHVEEFFTYAPNGTLYLMLVAQTNSMTDMVDQANDLLKTLLLSEDTNREIKCVGVALNPVMTSPITAVTIDTPGSGYQAGDTITVTGGGGQDFEAEVATVGGGGEIQTISINDNGTGYFAQPTAVNITGSGTGAAFTFTLGNRYSPTLTGGIDNDVNTAIPKAQALVEWLKTEHQLEVDNVLLEGRELNGTIADLNDLRTLDAENVSVVIAQDPAIASTDQAYAKYAAVGAALGMITVRQVNENLASVAINNPPQAFIGNESYPLTRTASSRWLTAALSSGALVSTLTSTDRKALNEKGWIFAGKFQGYNGIYFSDSPTAKPLSSDYAYIENVRTWNKASRNVRAALIPKMKGNIGVDADTGQIDGDTIKSWQALAQRRIDQMITDGELSAGTVTIDPAQDVLATSEVVVTVDITPNGVARNIVANIGFTNPFNS